MDLSFFPVEVIWRIAYFLDFADLVSFEETSTIIKDVIDDPSFWKHLCALKLSLNPSELLTENISKQTYKYISDIPTKLEQRPTTSRYLLLSDDCLSLSYSGRLGGDQVIYANYPFDPIEPKVTTIMTKIEKEENKKYKKLVCSSIMYFEIEIGKVPTGKATSRWRSDCVAIGLVYDKFPLEGYQPGWCVNSYGYHSDDGYVFHEGRSYSYGPKFGAGDTVGCGMYKTNRKIFFTHNGKFLGNACIVAPDVPLYPVVGIDCYCPIIANFGDSPFMFDIENHDISNADLAVPHPQILFTFDDIEDSEEDSDSDSEEEENDNDEDFNLEYESSENDENE